jgi:hypothetical protein
MRHRNRWVSLSRSSTGPISTDSGYRYLSRGFNPINPVAPVTITNEERARYSHLPKPTAFSFALSIYWLA